VVELGNAAGDVLQMELRLGVDKPRFTTIRPESRQLKSNCVELTGLRRFRLANTARGQNWVSRHRNAEKKNITVELGFAYCESLWKIQGGRITFQPKNASDTN